MAYRILLIILFALLPLSAFSLPFNEDMVEYQLSPGQISRGEPKGSIAVGAAHKYIANKKEAESFTNPNKKTESSVRKGKRLFSVNCQPCHGKIGPKENYVIGKVVMGAPNLADKTYHERTDGEIFRTIYFGNLIMQPVGWKLSHEEAWDIVNFIREVQGK